MTNKAIELFESIIGKKPEAYLHEPVYQVTESELLEFAQKLAAPLSPDHSGGGAGMVLPERDALHDLIAEVIGGDTYDCVRVWSAWGVGTMSEDDFVPLVDQDERLYEIADAVIDKVKELNQ